MKPRGHRFPASIILKAVEMRHKRLHLSYREIADDMMIVHGYAVSHKTIFEWSHKFKGSELTKLKKLAASENS